MATAVVLPGRRYGHAQAGLRLTELTLEEAGLELVRVEWPEAGMPHDADAAAAAVREIAAPLLDQEPAYVVAKSLGTLAAPVAAERGIAAVWLTPLLDEMVCREGVLANQARQLLVGGDQDVAWNPAVAHEASGRGARVVQLAGANHGLEVEGDAVASAETLVTLARAVREFLGS
jgi:hypothetical protein